LRKLFDHDQRRLSGTPKGEPSVIKKLGIVLALVFVLCFGSLVFAQNTNSNMSNGNMSTTTTTRTTTGRRHRRGRRRRARRRYGRRHGRRSGGNANTMKNTNM